MNKTIVIIFVLTAVLVFFVMSDKEEMTPEDQVRQMIEAGQQAAEARNHTDFSELIHKGYRDPKGLNKKQLIQLVRAYFFRHKNIHLLVKVDDIQFHSDNQAFVVLHIAMAGNVITDTSVLESLRANIYRFELHLIDDDGWSVNQASWKWAKISDMLKY